MTWKRPDKLRTRTVPMRVLDLGMSRTGTTSMCVALEQLGCASCYHLDYDSDDCAFWVAAMEAKYEGKGKPFGKAEWDHIFADYDVVSDLPVILFGPELVEAYPEAKVLLTVRSLESWHRSMLQTVCNPIYRGWYHRFPALVFPKEQALCDMSDKCEEIAWKGDCASYGKQYYLQHNDTVRQLVSDDAAKPLGERKFLEWQLGEGWDRLAAFLNHDTPAVEYPSGNGVAEFMEEADAHAREMWLAACKKVLSWGVVAGSALAWAWWLKTKAQKRAS